MSKGAKEEAEWQYIGKMAKLVESAPVVLRNLLASWIHPPQIPDQL